MDTRKWFRIAAYTLEITGLLIVVGALIPGALDAVTGLLFWPAADVTLDGPARLGSGIAGAVLAGWGATMAVLGRDLDRLDASVVGRAFAVGAVTWFVLDGATSITVGAYLNLPGNLLFLALMLAPSVALSHARGTAHA